MSSTSAVLPPLEPVTDSHTTGLAIVAVGTVLFLTIVGVVSKSLHWLFDNRFAATARSRATLTISGSALGELIVFVLLVLFLRYRGRSLRDLGFGKSSLLRGWIASAVFTALYVWVVLGTALKSHASLAELSAFHLYGSLAAGLSAGLVEETFFRGFVMNQLRWAGFGTPVQVIASGLATGVLGVFFALTYVASRRSLMPVMIGHMVMDLLIEPWLILVTIASTMTHLHS